MDERSAVWQELHNGGTSADRLSAIAHRYPEFHAAIGSHPNATSALRAWAHEIAARSASSAAPAPAAPAAIGPTSPAAPAAPSAPSTAGPAPAPMWGQPASSTEHATPAHTPSPAYTPPPRKKRGALIATVLTLALLVGGATWGATTNFWGLTATKDPTGADPTGSPTAGGPTPTVSASPTASGEPLPAAEPLKEATFVGKSMDWLLPTTDEVTAILPDATAIETYDSYAAYGESEGFIGYPKVCSPIVFHDFSFMSGFRQLRWKIADAPGATFYQVTQVPTAEQGQDVWELFDDASMSCDSYVGREGMSSPAYSFAVIATRDENYTQAFLGKETVTAGTSEYIYDEYLIAAHHGNVLVRVTVPVDGVTEDQMVKLLDLVVANLTSARAAVADDLGRPLG